MKSIPTHHGEAVDQMRCLKTVVLFTAYFICGMSIIIMGTTMLDMEEVLQTDTKTYATVFIGDGFGYMIGVLLCSVLYHKFCPEIQLGLSFLLKCLFLTAAPWIPSLPVYFALILLKSAAFGYFDSCSQSFKINLWKGHPWLNPVIQGSHATLSVGAVIGPLIVRLFVSQRHDSQIMNVAEVKPSDNISGIGKVTEDNISGDISISATQSPYDIMSNDINITDSYHSYEGNVQYVFVLFGGLYLIPGISFMLFALFTKTQPQPRKSNEQVKKNYDTSTCLKPPKLLFYVLMFLFTFAYVALEFTITSYLTMFAIQGAGVPKYVGILCMSVFFACFGLGRFIAIPLSTRIKPHTLLLIDILLTGVAIISLLFIKFHTSVIWIGTALLGLGVSSTFPTLITWMSKCINFNGRASGVLYTGVSLAITVIPALAGYLFQTLGPHWVVYLMLIECGAMLVIYVCKFILVNYYSETFNHSKLTLQETTTFHHSTLGIEANGEPLKSESVKFIED